MGPAPASHSFTPPKEGSPEGGKSQETKDPSEYIGLDHGAELGDLPRHPNSAQAQGQQRKGSSDVAWDIVQSGAFVVWCFVFLLLFSF